ncbi:MAG: hypothetical protein ACLTBQ_03615 [Thomasclavelia sp.]|uniref:hypothetical protein n=1 Tax=Thomasclavelia sp. TaxID=3025757 RepID=UPI0039969914
MYINTRSYQEMKISICEILNIDNKQLDDLLEKCYQQFQANQPVFILDDQYQYFLDYVKKHLIVDLDEILFIHLSRRLDDDNNGYNLIDVLTKDTALSAFFKKYGITFKYDGVIRIFKNNLEIDLLNDDEVCNYLRYRFGYVIKDYSIKGYAFGDALNNNDNYEMIQAGPELFQFIYNFVDDDLIDDFIENSKLYQFDYLLPFNQIWFENYEELNDQEKQHHLVVKVLQRLYAYKYENTIFDDDNPVIGIKNNQTIEENSLISKIEVN